MSHRDIELTQKELESITRYEKTWGASYVEKSINYRKAYNFLDQNFDIVRESKNKGRCFNVGTIVYTRKDGQKIQPEDFEALQVMDLGQANWRTIADDELSMTHRWECDSGD